MRRTQSKVRGKIPRKETQGEIDTEGTITIGKHEENDAPLHDPAHSDAKFARASCVSHMQPAFLASFNLQVNRNLGQHDAEVHIIQIISMVSMSDMGRMLNGSL